MLVIGLAKVLIDLIADFYLAEKKIHTFYQLIFYLLTQLLINKY